MTYEIHDRLKDVSMTFPSPMTEVPSQRFKEASDAAHQALEQLIASANEAGWGTEEITVAFAEAANFLKDAHRKDPDPAGNSSISGAAKEQIGHGELYD
ncbi:phage-related minor tail protein [Rhizobium mongolense]|uniref:Phage-related minor tail protein n=2 Tax=Rhizobium mongolense TaxID=57676 RepID=A0ABR6IP93_9HYPH|nr:phage-related minor tail protein [Rhizobium mongolense]